MADYISREGLIGRLGRNLAACNPGTFSEGCYADAIETVRNFPAADVAPVRRWIPVSERLPENGVSVLGWYKDNPFARFCPEIVSWNGKGWVFVYAQRYVTDVTHWMPLPEPPKMGGGAEDG